MLKYLRPPVLKTKEDGRAEPVEGATSAVRGTDNI